MFRRVDDVGFFFCSMLKSIGMIFMKYVAPQDNVPLIILEVGSGDGDGLFVLVKNGQ